MKSLSCVQLLVTPWTAAYQAPPSMGFSSQEYWSGVPLPSPKLLHLCPTHCKPMDCSRQGPLPVELSRQEYWSGLPYPPPGDLPNPGIKPRSAALQADSLLSEPPGKPHDVYIHSFFIPPHSDEYLFPELFASTNNYSANLFVRIPVTCIWGFLTWIHIHLCMPRRITET